MQCVYYSSIYHKYIIYFGLAEFYLNYLYLVFLIKTHHVKPPTH